MKKYIYIILTILPFSKVFSQVSQISGIATYKYIDWFGKPTIYKLYFDTEKSKYIANKGKKERINKMGETVITKTNLGEVVNQNSKVFSYFLDEEGDVVYKNWKDSVLVLREIQRHYPLIVREPKLPKINWQLIEEFKKVGNFNCQKAITTFRGRKYEVWFTSEIPIPTGPWKLHGLPGLILEAQDESMKYIYLFESIETPLSDFSELNTLPQNGDNVSLLDYNNEVKNREAEYNRILLSKVSERGGHLTITPHNNPPQELKFDQEQ